MAFKGPRWVVVDDSDSGIKYEGDWFASVPFAQDGGGDYGPTFKHGLHGTTSNASISYAFNGNHVRIYGTNNVTNSSTGVIDPSFQCFVDGVDIGIRERILPYRNQYQFCQIYGLSDGPHVITLNTTIRNEQPFWFDMVQYVPSHEVPLDNAMMEIDSSDPMIKYSPGWVDDPRYALNVTSITNAFASIEFHGVYFAWVGKTPAPGDYPANPSAGTYTVDQGEAVSFSLAGSPSQIGKVFFEVSGLSPGHHNITVKYQGDKNTTPLNLDYLFIQNATETTTTTPSSTPLREKSTNIGAIVGGVVGGVGGLALLLFLFFFLRRRRRKQNVLPTIGAASEGGNNFIVEQFVDDRQPGSPGPSRPEMAQQHTSSFSLGSQPRYLSDAIGKRRHVQAGSESQTSSSGQALTQDGTQSSGPPAVRHEDSGIRLGMVDPPPHYTSG